eukprot:scaffold9191_cov114-Isochrysis_galbana.AAC.5
MTYYYACAYGGGWMGTYGGGVCGAGVEISKSGGYIGANGTRSSRWVLPAVKGTIKRSNRTLALYGRDHWCGVCGAGVGISKSGGYIGANGT